MDKENFEYLKREFEKQKDAFRAERQEHYKKEAEKKVWSENEVLNKGGREREDRITAEKVEKDVKVYAQKLEPEIFQDYGGSIAEGEKLYGQNKEQLSEREKKEEAIRGSIRETFNERSKGIERDDGIDI